MKSLPRKTIGGRRLTKAEWTSIQLKYGQASAKFMSEVLDKRYRHNREIAKRGGEATAMYDNAEIVKALKVYKHAPGSKAGITAAVQSVCEQFGYANPTSLWKRLRGIAKNQTPTAFYKAL